MMLLDDVADGDLVWQERALCAQIAPDLWFPDKGGDNRQAKAVCWRCEVRVECLVGALKRDERHGIWGGMSVAERDGLMEGRDVAEIQPEPVPARAVA